MKVLLWSVERMIGGLSGLRRPQPRRPPASCCRVRPTAHVRRDGAYGEAKAALDAVVTRWSAESSWGSRTTLAHTLIGWVRGTGLMGGNDPMVAAVEAAGVRTWSTDEMAAELLALYAAAADRCAAGTAVGRSDRRARPVDRPEGSGKGRPGRRRVGRGPVGEAADAGIGPAAPGARPSRTRRWPGREIGVKPEGPRGHRRRGRSGHYGSAHLLRDGGLR